MLALQFHAHLAQAQTGVLGTALSSLQPPHLLSIMERHSSFGLQPGLQPFSCQENHALFPAAKSGVGKSQSGIQSPTLTYTGVKWSRSASPPSRGSGRTYSASSRPGTVSGPAESRKRQEARGLTPRTCPPAPPPQMPERPEDLTAQESSFNPCHSNH